MEQIKKLFTIITAHMPQTDLHMQKNMPDKTHLFLSN